MFSLSKEEDAAQQRVHELLAVRYNKKEALSGLYFRLAQHELEFWATYYPDVFNHVLFIWTLRYLKKSGRKYLKRIARQGIVRVRKIPDNGYEDDVLL